MNTPEIETYKQQEIALILLNIAVLAALFLVHIIFLFEIGRPSKFLLITLSVRFIVLIIELLWLQKTTAETGSQTLTFYTHLSIVLNIVFAFIASSFGGTPGSHYSVLMVIPIIQAAYRFGLRQTLFIVAITIVLTFLEVWIFFRQKPPIDYGEFFEAATVSLIFLVVGFVVWLLIGNLREEESKLKASLAALEEAQNKLVDEEKMAAIGQLSSAVAHEIRNPVAMIASSLAMAEKQSFDSPMRAEMLGIATQESKRLEILTDDFLAFARTKEPDLKPTSIYDLLDYTAGLGRAKAAEKNLQITVQCPADLMWQIDASQIQQALLNLLVNAFDASAESGKEVFLTAAKRDNNLILAVENKGKEIGENVVERIFDPFFTAKSKGTGLGLSIVRKIAHNHRGDVALAENTDGKVRFEISIPNQANNGKSSNN